LWFPRKDLLAAIAEAGAGLGVTSSTAGMLLAQLRDFARENAGRACALIPAFQAFVDAIRRAR
jgi:hypothetical protein